MIKGLDQKGRPVKVSPCLKMLTSRLIFYAPTIVHFSKLRSCLINYEMTFLCRKTYSRSASRIWISSVSVTSLRKLNCDSEENLIKLEKSKESRYIKNLIAYNIIQNSLFNFRENVFHFSVIERAASLTL